MTVVMREPAMPQGLDTLSKSRAYCRDLTRREARNFYYGLKLLPEPKRSAMYALYAYMRLVDDIADDEGNGRTVERRRMELDQWEGLTHQAVDAAAKGENGEGPRGHILWPAFTDMVREYRVPAKVFEDMIAGQRQDLEPVAIEHFEALREYCYRVASVVGVASLYVFGFQGGEETLRMGADRGIAFQLTNVLRDLREDARRGRCYIPREELVRFGISAGEIAEGRESAAFGELMVFQMRRAESYFERSAALDARIETDSRPTLRAMTGIYRGLLNKIGHDPAAVLRGRVCLSGWNKLRIAWRAMRGG